MWSGGVDSQTPLNNVAVGQTVRVYIGEFLQKILALVPPLNVTQGHSLEPKSNLIFITFFLLVIHGPVSYHFKDKWPYWSTMQIFVSAVFNAPIKRVSS